MADASITAVIVAFNPDPGAFDRLLQAVARQVSRVIVVDNGSDNSDAQAAAARSLGHRCSFHRSPRNIGLAAAQNLGIEEALSSASEYVLLLDDDSTPGEGMVRSLLTTLDDAARRGDKVAAAGPSYIEERSGSRGRFVRYGMLGATRVACRGNEVLRVDELIASGMLIPARALREVGLMDATLFIDHVDTDWCMRARARGYSLLGVCSARMIHRLGERPSISLRGRRMFFRSPTRHYYMFRNSVLLYRRPHAAVSWALRDAFRLAAMLGLIAVFCAPRLEHCCAIAKGLRDGLLGRSGPRA